MNFVKSSLFGINVSRPFQELTEGFLHCKLSSLPFKYLGFPKGVNLKKEGT